MRVSDRRRDMVRRRIINILQDPVLKDFSRGKEPKEIALTFVRHQLIELRRAGKEAEAERVLRAKIRWVERRIMRSI